MADKKKFPIGWVVGGSLVLIAGGFAYHINRQLNKVEDETDYNILKVLPTQIDKANRRVKLSFIIELINNSDIDLKISSYDIGLYINGKFVGFIKGNKDQYIKAKGKTKLVIDFWVNLKQYFNIGEILKLLIWFVSDKSKIFIGMKGHIAAKHYIFNVNYDIDEEFNLGEY